MKILALINGKKKAVAEQEVNKVIANAITKVEFESRTTANKEIYAGSGFVEWGAKHNTLINQNVGSGMFVMGTLPNSIILGSGTLTPDYSESKTNHPVVNVNGLKIRVGLVNESSTSTLNMIYLPEAPNSAAFLSRQDFVGLEVWHEDVSEKDFVYPFGNVQYGAAAWNGINLIAGNFTGKETYSLFGNWQSANALVGKGVKWSTLSDADKIKFLSDPENNIYLDNGKIIQVRYRIRVVSAPASGDWAALYGGEVDPQKNFYGEFNRANKINPKGKLVSLSADLGGNPGSYYVGKACNEAQTEEVKRGISYPGAFVATIWSGVHSPRTEVAHEGKCYMLPIALVHRRNQGAYHPKFNPNGIKWILRNNLEQSQPCKWYATIAYKPNSTADCFNPSNYRNIATTSSYSGSIKSSSNNTPRPDGLCYDQIHHTDVKDLRISAKKKPIAEILEEAKRKAIVGELRGIERTTKLFKVIWTNVTDGRTVIRVDASVVNASSTQNELRAVYINGVKYAIIATSSNRTDIYVNGDVTANVRVGNEVVVENTASPYFAGYPKTEHFSAEPLHCAIIGDPANYPDNISGEPLLVDCNGNLTIPDGSEITYNFPRKVKKIHLAIWTADKGATWTVSDFPVDAVTNSVKTDIPAGRVYLVFYASKANGWEVADNADVKYFDKEVAGLTEYLPEWGSDLISNLIGKVPTGASWGNNISTPLTKWQFEYRTNIFNTSTPILPTHQAINLASTNSPAAKVFFYLTQENNQYYLQCVFKELKHNGTSWGDNGKFEIRDDVRVMKDNNNQDVVSGQKRYKLNYFYSR